jgi:hypothetical protein
MCHVDEARVPTLAGGDFFGENDLHGRNPSSVKFAGGDTHPCLKLRKVFKREYLGLDLGVYPVGFPRKVFEQWELSLQGNALLNDSFSL